MQFSQANQTVHPVEAQWHYPILVAQGFCAETKSAEGFVRAYTYVHPNGLQVRCVTGSNADYWHSSNGASGIGLSLRDWATRSRL